MIPTSIVYFSQLFNLSGSELASEISRLFPQFVGKIVTPGAGGENDNLLKIGNAIIAILNIDLPQPAETLEEAYKVNFTWTEAREVIGKHQSHVVLSVMGDTEGFASAKANATALAMAALALAGLHDALAVFWAPSRALLRGKSVSSEIEDMQAGRLPLDLWVAFSPWQEQETLKVGLLTVGLESFVGREIEMIPRNESLGSAVQRALALAEYLLTKGPVVKDGDTVGYSETERLKIDFRGDIGAPVMQVLSEEIVP